MIYYRWHAVRCLFYMYIQLKDEKIEKYTVEAATAAAFKSVSIQFHFQFQLDSTLCEWCIFYVFLALMNCFKQHWKRCVYGSRRERVRFLGLTNSIYSDSKSFIWRPQFQSNFFLYFYSNDDVDDDDFEHFQKENLTVEIWIFRLIGINSKLPIFFEEWKSSL